jgi:hypothetical protein
MDALRYKDSVWRYTLIAGLFLFTTLLSEGAFASSENEQLIIFTQPDGSAVESFFRENHLPQIRKIAQEMGVSVYEVDARKGSPAEVAITPLIVYQNHRGRSIYQGRTTTPTRIRNFIRCPPGKRTQPASRHPHPAGGSIQDMGTPEGGSGHRNTTARL